MELVKLHFFCPFSCLIHGVESEACSNIVHSIPKFLWAWTSTSLIPQHASMFHVGKSVQNGPSTSMSISFTLYWLLFQSFPKNFLFNMVWSSINVISKGVTQIMFLARVVVSLRRMWKLCDVIGMFLTMYDWERYVFRGKIVNRLLSWFFSDIALPSQCVTDLDWVWFGE